MKSYYEELDRFAREAGIKDSEKKSYCQYFTRGGCLATSQKTCKGCRMFCPTTPTKIEIVVGHALKLERLNGALAKENDALTQKNYELGCQISSLNNEISAVKERINKLGKRAEILKYLKPNKIGSFFVLSLLRKKQTPQVVEKDRHLSKKLMKEWDEIRLLLNPNARR